MSKKRVLLDEGLMQIVIKRLCLELSENYFPFENTVLIGLQPRGINLLTAIIAELKIIHPDLKVVHGCVVVANEKARRVGGLNQFDLTTAQPRSR